MDNRKGREGKGRPVLEKDINFVSSPSFSLVFVIYCECMGTLKCVVIYTVADHVCGNLCAFSIILSQKFLCLVL